MFTVHQDPLKKESAKGFQMRFKNGNTISVMFGIGNYSSHTEYLYLETSAKLAEVAIWNDQNEFYKFGDNNVNGWVTTNEVAELIQIAATTIF